MDYIYKNIGEYNPNKKRKALVVFDDMIADMLSNKKVSPMVTEFLIDEWNYIYLSCFYLTISFFCAKKY